MRDLACMSIMMTFEHLSQMCQNKEQVCSLPAGLKDLRGEETLDFLPSTKASFMLWIRLSQYLVVCLQLYNKQHICTKLTNKWKIQALLGRNLDSYLFLKTVDRDSQHAPFIFWIWYTFSCFSDISRTQENASIKNFITATIAALLSLWT